MTRETNIARKLSIVLMALGATFAYALTAFAAANTSGLVQINLAGNGTGALAAGSCVTPAIACRGVCECLTGVDTVTGSPNQGFNGGSLTFELSVDTVSSPLPVSTVGDCLPAGGFASLKNSKGNITVKFDISGIVCPTVDGLAEVFNGSYWVSGGSGGKSSFIVGTGAINGSLAATVARIALNGNLQH